jgi:hypothetical protein
LKNTPGGVPMSKADYETLVRTGKLPATAETFVSPTNSYSAQYNGVLVKFEVKPGTTQSLESIGIRNNAGIAKETYPNMSQALRDGMKTMHFLKQKVLVGINPLETPK